MSNTQVGSIYAQIISDVIESSRVDVEEGGVDEHVLDELRQAWQSKLSNLQVAIFPWDPKPDPPQALAVPPPVPSNAGVTYQPMVGAPQQMGQPMSGQYMGNPAMAQGAPRIKAEPGLDSPTHATQQLYPTPASAADRAAMNLQNQYGQRAAASISAIQGSVGRQQQIQQQGQPQQMNMQQRQQAMQQQHQAPQPQQQFAANGQQNGQQRPSMTPEQYKAMLAHQQRMQAQNAQNTSVGNAQTDGAGDEGASYSLIKQVNANGEEVMGRIEIDEIIRDKIAAMGQRMEGGGLMLPLALATNSKKRQRKVTKSTSGMGQLDGGDSDDDDKNGLKNEELDEDAINSDLDDPEDELNGEDDEDGDNMGSIMLCMYDKVQRVKNKWKCVMKDGVLTVNGKDYVFHKANGEYEW